MASTEAVNFKKSNRLKCASEVFWGTLQTHDIMWTLLLHKFKGHLNLASKLLIHLLCSNVPKSKVKKLKKVISSAMSTADKASNVVTKALQQVRDLKLAKKKA